MFFFIPFFAWAHNDQSLTSFVSCELIISHTREDYLRMIRLLVDKTQFKVADHSHSDDLLKFFYLDGVAEIGFTQMTFDFRPVHEDYRLRLSANRRSVHNWPVIFKELLAWPVLPMDRPEYARVTSQPMKDTKSFVEAVKRSYIGTVLDTLEDARQYLEIQFLQNRYFRVNLGVDLPETANPPEPFRWVETADKAWVKRVPVLILEPKDPREREGSRSLQ